MERVLGEGSLETSSHASRTLGGLLGGATELGTAFTAKAFFKTKPVERVARRRRNCSEMNSSEFGEIGAQLGRLIITGGKETKGLKG